MTGRECGECTLCCKLLPVRSLKKLANQRCLHQRKSSGCAIYSARPPECVTWNCQWLTDPEAHELRRPDRSHYVVDVIPDMIRLSDPDGETIEIPVMQVWCDAAWPHAHRDPALRRLIERRGMPAVVRYSNTLAFTIFPPSLVKQGRWEETPVQEATMPSLIDRVLAGAAR